MTTKGWLLCCELAGVDSGWLFFCSDRYHEQGVTYHTILYQPSSALRYCSLIGDFTILSDPSVPTLEGLRKWFWQARDLVISWS